MKMLPLPNRKYLKKIFLLNVKDGTLIWRRREGIHESWNTKYAGKIAGDPMWSSGYMRVGIDGKRYLLHRIIFKMFYGREPSEIDHKDTDFLNNRPSNLREAEHGCNIANGRKRQKTRGLPKGVGLKRGRYSAYIRKHGVAHHLGYFSNPETAHAAYCAAARRFHGEFARFE